MKLLWDPKRFLLEQLKQAELVEAVWTGHLAGVALNPHAHAELASAAELGPIGHKAADCSHLVS